MFTGMRTSNLRSSSSPFYPALLHVRSVSSRLLSRNAILPVVLYGCETWSLTLKEEHRLRLFENMVLRRILRPKRDEVTGE
jgi:hypothetical protein